MQEGMAFKRILKAHEFVVQKRRNCYVDPSCRNVRKVLIEAVPTWSWQRIISAQQKDLHRGLSFVLHSCGLRGKTEDEGGQTRSGYLDRVLLLYFCSPSLTHACSQTMVVSESSQGSDPIGNSAGQETVYPMFDDLTIYPDGRCDDGERACHILNQFVPTFPALRWVVGQRHDADVTTLDFRNLCLFCPCS